MSGYLQNGLSLLTLNGFARDPPPDPDLPFPNLVEPPANIPQSDIESERTLDNARLAVLDSPDPEIQLIWAQDVLRQVGINIDNRERLTLLQLPVPKPHATEQQLKFDAINIVTFLAEQRHPMAEFILGTWHEFARFGRPLDKQEAFRCYSRAAEKGFARAEYRLGMYHEAGNDLTTALPHYLRGVEAEDPACLYRIGMMTLRGQHGQAQDFVRGLDMIAHSANLADENAPQGAYVYGMMLAGQLPQVKIPENFLPIDEIAARIEIDKAAFLKFSKAQLKMGSAYELGSLGCNFDPTYSLHYYQLAARQGEPEAEMGISKWFLVGHENLFIKNQQIAYSYANRAAASGFANAEFAMGYFNEVGINVPQNITEALAWYAKAEQHGNHDAKTRILGINSKQMLSQTDHEKIAVSRIKSQHGSQRGPRPKRTYRPADDMSTITQSQASTSQSGTGSYFPPRASSMTYTSDSGSQTVAPSMTPYPIDNEPPSDARRRQPSRDDYVPPAVSPAQTRVSSARPASAAPTQSTKPRYPSGPPPIRPATTFETSSRTSDMRHASSPIHRPHQQPPAPINTSHPPSRSHNNSPASRPPDLQRLSIGYIAPLDTRLPSAVPSSPIIRKRPHAHTPPASAGPSSHPAQYHRRKSSAGPHSAGPERRHTPTSSLASSQTKSSGYARPQQYQQIPPRVGGPKTFEEMGVPITKMDSDCVCFVLYIIRNVSD